jgi:hypothetical protein
LSQGWVEEKIIGKAFSTPKGAVVPAETKYYVISAVGIDKIDGPTEFTRNRFSGIKIDATGQNIITLGDGNQVNSKFEDVGNSLSSLKEAIKNSQEITDEEKVNYVVDLDSIQDQLAKPYPNKGVIQTLWDGLTTVATISGVADFYNGTRLLIENILK